MELPAGVVYRLFGAQHARVSANIIHGMISVVRTLHSLVLHKCKASVLDVCIALFIKYYSVFKTVSIFILRGKYGKRDRNAGH